MNCCKKNCFLRLVTFNPISVTFEGSVSKKRVAFFSRET